MDQEENTTNTSAPPAPITPTKAIKKVLPNQTLAEGDIEQFMAQLQTLLDKIDLEQSEENAKNPFYDFLKETHYRSDYEINTQGLYNFVCKNEKVHNYTISHAKL